MGKDIVMDEMVKTASAYLENEREIETDKRKKFLDIIHFREVLTLARLIYTNMNNAEESDIKIGEDLYEYQIAGGNRLVLRNSSKKKHIVIDRLGNDVYFSLTLEAVGEFSFSFVSDDNLQSAFFTLGDKKQQLRYNRSNDSLPLTWDLFHGVESKENTIVYNGYELLADCSDIVSINHSPVPSLQDYMNLEGLNIDLELENFFKGANIENQAILNVLMKDLLPLAKNRYIPERISNMILTYQSVIGTVKRLVADKNQRLATLINTVFTTEELNGLTNFFQEKVQEVSYQKKDHK